MHWKRTVLLRSALVGLLLLTGSVPALIVCRTVIKDIHSEMDPRTGPTAVSAPAGREPEVRDTLVVDAGNRLQAIADATAFLRRSVPATGGSFTSAGFSAFAPRLGMSPFSASPRLPGRCQLRPSRGTYLSLPPPSRSVMSLPSELCRSRLPHQSPVLTAAAPTLGLALPAAAVIGAPRQIGLAESLRPMTAQPMSSSANPATAPPPCSTRTGMSPPCNSTLRRGKAAPAASTLKGSLQIIP